MPQLYPLLESSLISLRQITIETLSQLLPKLPEAEQTDLINHFKDIVLKQTDYFGLQMKALRALQPLKPEQIAPLVKEIVQHFATTSDQKNNYLILEILHGLGNIASPRITAFLQAQLNELNQEKQRWRTEQRDKVTSTETNLTPCNQRNIQFDKKELWPYSQWEFELGYALTRSNTEVGINLLHHNLALVRKGAWTALGEESDVELLKKLNKQRDQSQVSYFRYAAYQAIDGGLITLEYSAEEPQLIALQHWFTKVTEEALRDRLRWTIERIAYRLSQTQNH